MSEQNREVEKNPNLSRLGVGQREWLRKMAINMENAKSEKNLIQEATTIFQYSNKIEINLIALGILVIMYDVFTVPSEKYNREELFTAMMEKSEITKNNIEIKDLFNKIKDKFSKVEDYFEKFYDQIEENRKKGLYHKQPIGNNTLSMEAGLLLTLSEMDSPTTFSSETSMKIRQKIVEIWQNDCG